MPTAIKVDGKIISYANQRHIVLLRDYQDCNALTDDEIDSMIESGRIEFGSAFLNKKMELEFCSDETRNSVYSSIHEMIWVNGNRC